MDRLAPAGRLFLAASLIAFGVQHFLFGDFVPGRAPAWPASLPGRLLWAYVSGAVFIATGVAIVSGKKARWAAVVSGTLIFLWAVLRNVPPALADTHYGGAWTNLGKALALFGGCFALAGSLPGATDSRFLTLGRFCLGAFLASSGVQHFLFVPFVMTLVPAWIPGGGRLWTYFAGVALIAGGAGLMLRPIARLAGALSGLMIGLWVIMLHVPRALGAPADQSRNEWIAVFEAVAMSGIAFVVIEQGRAASWIAAEAWSLPHRAGGRGPAAR